MESLWAVCGPEIKRRGNLVSPTGHLRAIVRLLTFLYDRGVVVRHSCSDGWVPFCVEKAHARATAMSSLLWAQAGIKHKHNKSTNVNAPFLGDGMLRFPRGALVDGALHVLRRHGHHAI